MDPGPYDSPRGDVVGTAPDRLFRWSSTDDKTVGRLKSEAGMGPPSRFMLRSR